MNERKREGGGLRETNNKMQRVVEMMRRWEGQNGKGVMEENGEEVVRGREAERRE